MREIQRLEAPQQMRGAQGRIQEAHEPAEDEEDYFGAEDDAAFESALVQQQGGEYNIRRMISTGPALTSLRSSQPFLRPLGPDPSFSKPSPWLPKHATAMLLPAVLL